MLRATYRSIVLSVMSYGVSAWGPWLCKSGWERLERKQLEAGRVIGGMLRGVPREAVLAEAGVRSVVKVAKLRWLLEWDK